MARDRKFVTLGLNFEINKDSLQKISQTLDTMGKSKLSTSKSNTYLQSLIGDVNDYIKQIRVLQKELQKPMKTRTQAKEIGYAMTAANSNISKKFGSTKSSITKTFSSPKNSQNILDIKNIGKQINALQSLIDKIKELRKANSEIGTVKSLETQRVQAKTGLKQLGRKDTLTADEVKQQKELSKVLDEVNKKLAEKAEIQNKINALLQSKGFGTLGEAESARTDLISQQNELRDDTIGLQDHTELEKIINDLKEIVGLFKQSTFTAEQLGDSYDEATNEMRQAEEQQRTFNEVLSQLGIPLLTISELARMLRQVIDYSYEYVKNLDKALTEIAVVSDKSRSEVMELTDTFIDLSAKTGMAIDDIAQASTIFYQQGLSDEAVKKMSEYTAIFAKISGEDVPTAADQLTAAINGFGYSADQVASVVDKLSVLAAYSAADTEELATAMSKAASQASMAGLTFDQYNAYLATMIETTREAPENIGTSLKTIMSRFQEIKKGTNTEDDVDVNRVETALKSVGVQLRDTDGQLRDLGDVLNELGPKWASLDRNTQAYLGTVIAGTRQQSRFISLMQHWDRALELTAASENSAGAAAAMHKKAMDGLEATINELTNAWQKLISNLANGDTFKGVIKILTGIIKWFAKGNSLMKIISATMLIINTKTLIQNANLDKQNEKVKNLDIIWGEIGNKIKTVFTNTRDAITATDALADAQARYNNELDKTNAKKGKKVAPEPTTSAPTEKSGKNAGKNIVDLVGKGQSIIWALSTFMFVVQDIANWIVDLNGFTQNDLDKINKKIDKTQEEIDKQDELISITTDTLDIYHKLNKKVSLTTSELEDLGDAAKKIAETLPDAVMGYDENGNPIINEAMVKAEGLEANSKRALLAQQQMGNLLYKDMAEEQVAAIQEYEASAAGKAWDTTKTVGQGITATGLAIAASTAVIPEAFSKIATVGGLVIAGIGLVVDAIGIGGDAIAENNARIKAAQKTIDKTFSGENLEKLIKEMSIAASAVVGNGTVTVGNIATTEQERNVAATTLAQTWIANRRASLKEQLANGDIDEKDIEKKMEELGSEWTEILVNDLGGTQGLAKLTAKIKEYQPDIANLTYDSLEDGFETFMAQTFPDIEKSSELYQSLEQAFLQAALQGTSGGLLLAVKTLQAKIDAAQTDEEKAAYQAVLDQVKSMTTKEADMYGASGIFDNIDLFNKIYEDNGDSLRKSINTSAAAPNLDFISALTQAKDDYYKAAQQLLDEAGVNSGDDLQADDWEKYNKLIENAEDAAATIENIWNSMTASVEATWQELFDTIDRIFKRTSAGQKALAELRNDGGMAVDTFKEWMTTTIDTIDFTAMSTDELNRYRDAMYEVRSSMELVDGQIVLNQSAMEKMIEIDKLSAQQAIETEKAKLNTKKMELEAYLEILKAERDTLEYKLGMGKTEVDANKAWNKAKDKLNTVYQQHTQQMAGSYVDVFAAAYQANLNNYNKMLTAMMNGDQTFDYDKLADTWNENISKINLDEYEKTIEGFTDDELRQQLEFVNHEISATETTIERINWKMESLDIAEVFTEGGQALAASGKEAEKYIGKLEEIYNILRKIEGIQDRISLLQIFEDIGNGDIPAKALNERIRLYDELGDKLDDYVKSQKYIEKIEKNEILNSAVGGVFAFDEYNNIEILWDKYEALGAKEKQLADDLYDEWTKIHKDTLDFNKQRFENLQDEIEATQKLVDTYVNLENKMAQAVKDIYKEMLDNKLEAIDTEIEALNKLEEAYKKTNEQANNSKQLSDLQTNLKRSMMDTSGASNTKVLDYRDQIRSKLETMGQDEYTERLDDIKEALQDQKESLQKEFDEFFEDWTKLNELIDKYVMHDEEAVKQIYETTDEFKQANEVQRYQMMEQLDTEHKTAMSAFDETNGNVLTVAERITELKTQVATMDNHLQDPNWINSIGTQMSAVLKQYLIDNQSNSGGFGGSRGSGGDTKLNLSGSFGGSGGTGGSGEGLTGAAAYPYKGGLNAMVGKTVELDKKTKYKTYGTVGGSNPSEYTSPGWYEENVKIVEGPVWSDAVQAWLVKTNGSGAGTRYFVASADAHGQGLIRYFHDRGWGKSGTKYKDGGFVYHTGPAWLDGTKNAPEAVLNAAQTQAFMSLTSNLAKLDAQGNGLVGSNVIIDNISFEVESMSSPEDGEKAFDAFVNRFKEIGSQTGLSFNKAKI